MNLKQCRQYLFEAMKMLNEEIKQRRNQDHINNLELFCEIPTNSVEGKFYPLKAITEFFDYKYSSKRYGIELTKLGFVRGVKKRNNILFVGYYMNVIDPIDEAKLHTIRQKLYEN